MAGGLLCAEVPVVVPAAAGDPDAGAITNPAADTNVPTALRLPSIGTPPPTVHLCPL